LIRFIRMMAITSFTEYSSLSDTGLMFQPLRLLSRQN